VKRLAWMILAGFVLSLGVGCEAKLKTPTNTKGGPAVDPVPGPEDPPVKGGDPAKPG